MNIIDRFPELLNKYPAQVRTAVIAVVPAFIVFILMMATRPAHLPSMPPEVQKPKPVRELQVHILGKQEFNAVSKLVSQSSQLLQSLDQLMAKPANANEEACIGALRNGTASYIDTVLARLRQDIATSASMKNGWDEKYLNGNISAGISGVFKAMPALRQNIQRIGLICPNNAAVADQASQIKTLLDQASSVMDAVQKRILAHP